MNLYRLATPPLIHLLGITLVSLGIISLACMGVYGELRHYPAVPPPPHALLLLLTGLALFFAARKRTAIQRLTASILVVVAGYWLALPDIPMAPGEGRMALPAPTKPLLAAFFLLGLATLIGFRSRVARAASVGLGAAVIALVIASLGSDHWPAPAVPDLGLYYASSTMNLALVLAGIAGIMLALRPPDTQLGHRILLIGWIGVFAACIGWLAINLQTIDNTKDQSEKLLQTLHEQAAATAREHVARIDRLATRWNTLQYPQPSTLWEEETGSYLRDFPEIQLIGLVSADRTLQAARYRDPAVHQWLSTALVLPEIQAWLDYVLESGEPHISRAHTDGETMRNLVAVDVEVPGFEGWLVIAVQDIETALQPLSLLSPESLHVQIHENDHLLFHSDPAESQAVGYLGATAEIPLHHDVTWRASTYYSPDAYRTSSTIANAVLLAGMVFTFSLMLSLRLAGIARRTALDVAEQSEKLQVSEQRYRSMYVFNPDAVYSFDLEGRFTGANPAGLRIIEYDQEELLGQYFTRVALPEEAPKLKEYFKRAQAGDALHYQTRALSKSGRTIEFDVVNIPISVASRFVGIHTIAKDVTERNSLLRALTQKEQSLRLLQRALDASHNGVIIADATLPGNPVTYSNPAFERMMGYSPNDILGKSSSFLYEATPGRPETENLLRRLMDSQEVHVVRCSTRTNGTTFWADVYIAPVPDEHGKITHFICIQRDVTIQKRAEAQLAHTATHDVLTGLPNRGLLESRLRSACQLARAGAGVAVVFFDLDGFKPINDSMGHAAGDCILQEVAHRMRNVIRPDDFVARLSGDEFVMVLSGLPAADAESVTQRTIEAISEPYVLVTGVQHITASADIAFTETPVDEPMQLVQQADLAMYKAKRAGRNNFQWHTTDMSHSVTQRLKLRNELQRAIDQGELLLHYQPQFDRRNGRVKGIEALARWRHPERGMILPSEFVPVAEETGQIIALGKWALDTACSQNQWLHAQGLSDFAVAVNISPVQFQRKDFIRDIRETLSRTRLPAPYLKLEITEGVLLEHGEQTIRTLNELRQLGVRVSIDDFGTGFSSLSYLKNLPIDWVKIDRSFVCDIPDDPDDVAITKAILSMAHNLGLSVVAEGVETEAQLEFLEQNGCDRFQGYLFAAPMPLEDLVIFLQTAQGAGLGRSV